MSDSRLPLPISDELLMAYLDNQLSASEQQQLEQYLEQDSVLAQRLLALDCHAQPFAQAFEPLLAAAPVASLQQFLDKLPDTAVPEATVPATKAVNYSRRSLLAAAVGFLAVGTVLGRYVLPGERAQQEESYSWRNLVAQYMVLYSAQTLADEPGGATLQQQALPRVAKNLGLPLQTQQLGLPDAELKSARLLQYGPATIAQLTYLAAAYGPMALCITRATKAGNQSQQQEVRYGMNVVYWRKQGFDFMLIGHAPAATLAGYGQQLSAAI